jgi:hypothetical protein
MSGFDFICRSFLESGKFIYRIYDTGNIGITQLRVAGYG